MKFQTSMNCQPRSIRHGIHHDHNRLTNAFAHRTYGIQKFWTGILRLANLVYRRHLKRIRYWYAVGRSIASLEWIQSRFYRRLRYWLHLGSRHCAVRQTAPATRLLSIQCTVQRESRQSPSRKTPSPNSLLIVKSHQCQAKAKGAPVRVQHSRDAAIQNCRIRVMAFVL